MSFLLLAALAVLPYLNALGGAFVFDDRSLVVQHPAVSGAFHLGRILTARLIGDQPQPLWRPLTTLSYALDWRIGGGHPFWFHLVNLLLHAAVTVLFALLVRRLFRRDVLALAAGLLFAVHPIHTEAVSWIAGRADLFAALFTLAALHLALSPRPQARWWMLLAVFLGVASKESAAAAPLILLYTLWARKGRGDGKERKDGRDSKDGRDGKEGKDGKDSKDSKDRGDRGDSKEIPRGLPLAWGAAAFLPVAFFLILRYRAMGIWSGPAPDPMDNPMSGVGLIGRLPTVLANAGRAASLMIWPAKLSVDYTAPVTTLVHGFSGLALLGAVVLAGLVYLAWRMRQKAEGWGAGLALLSFALVSNLAVVIVTVFAERFLYLPSAGLLLVAASGASRLEGRLPRFALPAALALLLAAGAARTWVRNGDYHDSLSLYAAGVQATPQSSKLRGDLAAELLWAGRYPEAVTQAEESLRLDPTQRGLREVAACALDSLGRRDEALRFLRGWVQRDPADRGSRRRLLQMLMKERRYAVADTVAEEGAQQDAAEAEWLGWAAKSSQAAGDLTRAARWWSEVTERVPAVADGPLNLGYCLLAGGNMAGARDAYREALRRSPDNPAAENGLAWSLLETGGSADEAARLAAKASAQQPVGPYFDTLARACLLAGRCAEAEGAVERALALEPANADYLRRREEIRRRCR